MNAIEILVALGRMKKGEKNYCLVLCCGFVVANVLVCWWVYGCVRVLLYVLFFVCRCISVFTCIIVCCHPFLFTSICQLERKTTRFYILYRSYILRKTIYPSKQSCTTAAVNEFVTLRMKFLRMLLPASPIFIPFHGFCLI